MQRKSTIEKRYYKWDKLIIEKEYEKVVLEFDKLIKQNKTLTIGDLIRRNDALELMGVTPLHDLEYLCKFFSN
jgi:hypothetical protein